MEVEERCCACDATQEVRSAASSLVLALSLVYLAQALRWAGGDGRWDVVHGGHAGPHGWSAGKEVLVQHWWVKFTLG